MTDSLNGWRDIESAPKDETWFVALPRHDLGFAGEPYPPTVCRVRGPYANIDTGERTDYSVDCKAMNSGTSLYGLDSFIGWLPLPHREGISNG